MAAKSIAVGRVFNAKDRLSWCVLSSYLLLECYSLVVPTAADWTTFFEQIHGRSRLLNGTAGPIKH
jgi:hypothetical protein